MAGAAQPLDLVTREAGLEAAVQDRTRRRHRAMRAHLGLDGQRRLGVLRPGHAVRNDRRFQCDDRPVGGQRSGNVGMQVQQLVHSNHFRQNHHSSNDTTTETISEVISGKWKLKPWRSIEMSPGRRPHGSLASQGHSRPAATSSKPNATSRRCMRGLPDQVRTVAPPGSRSDGAGPRCMRISGIDL